MVSKAIDFYNLDIDVTPVEILSTVAHITIKIACLINSNANRLNKIINGIIEEMLEDYVDVKNVVYLLVSNLSPYLH